MKKKRKRLLNRPRKRNKYAKRKKYARRAHPVSKTRKSSRGGKRQAVQQAFPKQYRSPFKRFLKPVGRMKPRATERTFVLLLAQSVRKYEGHARRFIIPFEMGTLTRRQAERLDEKDIIGQWKLRGASLRKLELARIFPGKWTLKSKRQRKKLMTENLRRLLRIRARQRAGGGKRAKKRRR